MKVVETISADLLKRVLQGECIQCLRLDAVHQRTFEQRGDEVIRDLRQCLYCGAEYVIVEKLGAA